MIDPETLGQIIELLPPEYGSLLSRELEPRWKQRDRRLTARNVAVVVAAGGLGEVAPTRQARALERALARYLETAWLTERYAGPTSHSLALHRLALLNDGRGLGWRRIADILALHPMPPLQQSLQEVATCDR